MNSKQQDYHTFYCFEPKRYGSLEEWQIRAEQLRKQILVCSGLVPEYPRGELRVNVTGKQVLDGYSIENVYFESLPGLFVAGNLFRPVGEGPFPAILNPHGHWENGRFEQSPLVHVPARCADFARNGMIAFSYDMIGKGESLQIGHRVRNQENEAWGISLLGLQLFNSIRCVDYLCSLKDVDRERIGCTGASGGGTQTFLLAAVDPRIQAAAPVNMISYEMQGGCECENVPGLRIGTENVELASLIAPRPMMITGCTGDWTRHVPEREYPAIQHVYDLYGQTDKLEYFYCDSEHNYRRDVREAVCGWFVKIFYGHTRKAEFRQEEYGLFEIEKLKAYRDGQYPEQALELTELVKLLQTIKMDQNKRLLASSQGRQQIIDNLRILFGLESRDYAAIKGNNDNSLRWIGKSETDSGRRFLLRVKELEEVNAHEAADQLLQKVTLESEMDGIAELILTDNAAMIQRRRAEDENYYVFHPTNVTLRIQEINDAVESLVQKGAQRVYLEGGERTIWERLVTAALNPKAEVPFLQRQSPDELQIQDRFEQPGFRGLGGMELVLYERNEKIRLPEINGGFTDRSCEKREVF